MVPPRPLLSRRCPIGGDRRPRWAAISEEGAMGFLRRRPENTPSVNKRIPILRWIVERCYLVLLWAGILLIVPTERGESKIDGDAHRALQAGQVRLSAVRLGVCGGVRLEGLEIAETAHTADPWLKAETLALDLSILQLVSGQLLPKEIRAEGVSLRVHRRADGSLEFGDLIPGTRPRSTDSRDPGDDSDVPEVARSKSPGPTSRFTTTKATHGSSSSPWTPKAPGSAGAAVALIERMARSSTAAQVESSAHAPRPAPSDRTASGSVAVQGRLGCGSDRVSRRSATWPPCSPTHHLRSTVGSSSN